MRQQLSVPNLYKLLKKSKQFIDGKKFVATDIEKKCLAKQFMKAEIHGRTLKSRPCIIHTHNLEFQIKIRS